MGFVSPDIGSYIFALPGCAKGDMTSKSSTAGGAGTGYTIDRFGFSNGRANSCQTVAIWNADTTAAKTVTVNSYVEDSPEGTTWTKFSSTVIATNASGYYTVTTTAATTALKGAHRRDVNLVGANRYVRMRIDAYINSALTTLATYSGVMIFGGMEGYPAAT